MDKNGATTLDKLIPTLRQELEEKQAHLTKLEEELGAARAEFHRWKKVLTGLDPEALPPELEKPVQQRKRSARRTEARITDERYAQFRDDLLEYAKEHEEFRQVDVRGVSHIDTSALSESFERLRQEGIIRLARREGNAKWFRLTPAAVRSMA